jgi:glutaredoxin
MRAIVWSKDNCTFCDQAKALLEQRNIAYEERKIGHGYTREDLWEAVPTARAVPQIFVNNNHIGGFTELRKYIEETAGGYGD